MSGPHSSRSIASRTVRTSRGCAGVVVRANSSTAAACCLVALGHDPAAAIAIVRKARPGAVERAGQERFIEAFASATAR